MSRLRSFIENLDVILVVSASFIVFAIFYLVQDDTSSFSRWMWALQLPAHGFNLAVRITRKREEALLNAVDELIASHHQLRQKIRELLTPRE